MARRKKKQAQDERLLDLVETRNSVMRFFEENEKIIYGLVAGIVILIGGYFVWLNLYKYPRQEQAEEQMYQAQFMFERDSFARALNNPGAGYPGFLDIIDQYGGTKAGNLARYYTGVSYLHLGRYKDAVEYLKKFNADGKSMPVMKHGTLGDAYSELNELEKARSQYQKAVSYSNNDFLTPYYLKKLALLHQTEGKEEDALALFKRIKEEYPLSVEAQDVDKYIARLERK